MSLEENNLNGKDAVGAAVRYQNPNGSKWFNEALGRKIYIDPMPLKYLNSLNNYDQHRLCKGIEALASVASPMDGIVKKIYSNFFKAKQSTSTIFNFIVKYTLTAEYIVITTIELDSISLLSGDNQSLHNVKKLQHNTSFSSGSSLADIDELSSAWGVIGPVTKIKTKHAAVNGMLNDLRKASWLMGTHMEAAYPSDTVENYTLFHNPTESARWDFYESVKDNLGVTTPLAKHLAAILLDVQLAGESVKWVVHSQGGIIFKQALSHHLKQYPNQTLSKNSVAFHAGGHNKKETEKLLVKAGVKKETSDRDNPFDMVPNLAGRNALGPRALKRSFQFMGKVTGETSSPVESPHTLPFISLEAYHGFLTMSGEHKHAGIVRGYMNKLMKK